MTGSDTIRILGIAGSLRHGSFNRATLRAAQELAPEGMHIEVFDIAPIPLYNEDIRQQGLPPPVEDLQGSHQGCGRTADRHPGIQLFDSRRAEERHRLGVPAARAIVRWQADRYHGGMGGALGTARAQYHLRQCFVFLNGLVMNRPEVMIPAAQNKFDAQGTLTDDATRDFMTAHLAAFKAWVLRLR